MSTKVFPNGQQLVSDALTVDEINGVMQPLTLGMLGLRVDVNSGSVRLDWPEEGAPFQQRTDDVCYLRCTTFDGEYDKIRDEIVLANDQVSVTQQFNYTRTWTVHWTFYGPASTDNARAVKSALFIDYFTERLEVEQLFPVSEQAEPVRVPELIDGQWFERVDFECQMYEFVTETISQQSVLSAEVVVEDASGVIADVVVKL